MAQGLAEVRASLGRVLALNRPGTAHGLLARLAGYIDRGLAAVQGQQEQVKQQVGAIAAVAGVLDKQGGTLRQRRGGYQRLLGQYRGQGGEFYGRLAKVMKVWQQGLRGEGQPLGEALEHVAEFKNVLQLEVDPGGWGPAEE